ncbi:SDR family NAD(P)-dependent oxidoreductase [Nonomuraea sp. MCN248]|uniref:SDR family NAD(P)-dependent oxidoreductase n=1 Tax=Nonomuraea corallina TaxID=2989783 RepID=A0ABT4S540_9ACTN|nr:SDR family NAD(P)-dependent oxidoreductase [Nonomuraea corallina]MDA0632312.1 SDR family NAD(P)-dependent oxidoreductase [Nonomuraea corallina]
MRGKIVLATGGSSGIGYATARAFTATGATVMITGRDEGRLAASGPSGFVAGHDLVVDGAASA